MIFEEVGNINSQDRANSQQLHCRTSEESWKFNFNPRKYSPNLLLSFFFFACKPQQVLFGLSIFGFYFHFYNIFNKKLLPAHYIALHLVLYMIYNMCGHSLATVKDMFDVKKAWITNILLKIILCSNIQRRLNDHNKYICIPSSWARERSWFCWPN